MNGTGEERDPIDEESILGERQGRKGRRRSRTMSRKEIARDMRRERARGLDPELLEIMSNAEDMRPRSRSDCLEAERPCMWVSCKYHLWLDVNPETGSIKLNFPDVEIWEMEETCALDVADKGGITLEEVGEIMNLTRERIRQVEMCGLEKIREATDPDD
ncbi:MAG: sigma factor-like helix-turn-helix DNA-binding protein [Deltaproteobacteria bacterium]|nr:sigma factor-like helix-turn-helix DNA-binding protein [Deltaproteobacteria bacterium]